MAGRMARAAVEPKQPWAVRDDQAATQETAETLSQKGKGARDDGNGEGGTGSGPHLWESPGKQSLPVRATGKEK